MIFLNANARLLIIGGAALFSILVLFIILYIFLYQKRQHRHNLEKRELHNSFQQELLKTQLETQEQTFHQIGEELHDNIGQLLSSTRMLLGITERSLDHIPRTLITADQTLAKAIQDLRMLSKSLNKEWLSRFNLLENLRAEIDRLNAARTVGITLNSTISSIPLNAESRVMLFRIIQEALHNSIKHSQARSVRLDISMNDFIEVSIRDDGKGFDMDSNSASGVGLLNMHHRTALLGGKISWTSPAGIGTKVLLQIPVQKSSYMKINIAIADDHQLFLKSLGLLIENFQSFNILAEALNGESLIFKLENLLELPDIILIDVNMPVLDGAKTAEKIAEKYPQVKLVALSMKDDDISVINMIRAGCCAYLLKDIHPNELEKALIEIYHTGYYNADISNIRYRRLLQKQHADDKLQLSDREKTFVQLACSDLTYKQIADQMHLAERTIDGYRESLFQKLNVQSRVGMVLEAIRRNLANL